MCNCCNGVGHEFVSRGMKCKIVIRNDNLMTVYLPYNATDLPVKACPLCGRRLDKGTVSDQATDLKENLARLHEAAAAFANEMSEYRRTALDVAKYVVNTCIMIGHPISNSCLQHVLYELYKASLRRGVVLFYEEFQASPVGPRIPSVYDNFCAWGAWPITMKQNESDNPKKKIPDELKGSFNVIICGTVKVSLHDWVKISQRDESAWSRSYAKGEKNWIPVSAVLEEAQSEDDLYETLLNQM